MKRILFVYSEMILGGSTTSLLSLLKNLDQSKYSVDLLLFKTGGALYEEIPGYVRILKPETGNKRLFDKIKLRKALSVKYLIKYAYAKIVSRKYKNNLIVSQYMSHEITRFYPKIQEKYDVAIGYLEFTPLDYVAKYVSADKKIAWIHINYVETGMLPGIETRIFDRLDNIVLVSETCVNSFLKIYPDQIRKVKCIENILTRKDVIDKSLKMPSLSEKNIIDGLPKDKVKIASVSRIDFASKGHDRALKCMKRLIDEGEYPDFVWYIIGDGADLQKLKALIIEYDLEKYVICLGGYKNPFVILKEMDVFFIPSLYEGKPMAVTEALMLGLPVMATDYGSAYQQIKHGKDGIIFENSETGIYQGLKTLLQQPDLLMTLKANAILTEYDNKDEIEKVYGIID